MTAFSHHQNGRTLQLSAGVAEPRDDRWPFLLSGRYVELELTEDELEWLCQVGGPAALAARRS